MSVFADIASILPHPQDCQAPRCETAHRVELNYNLFYVDVCVMLIGVVHSVTYV